MTHSMPSHRLALLSLFLSGVLSGCASAPPLATVPQLNLDRYMGTWYVIGHIPPFLTDDAYNAVESYRRGQDSRVEVLFTYNKGAFDGPAKTLEPTAFTDQGTLPSEWGMRFIWPLKSDFRITYVDDDYQLTIVARNRRDYVWIMARDPVISPDTYQELVDRVGQMGYNTAAIRKVPQQARALRDDSAHQRYLAQPRVPAKQT